MLRLNKIFELVCLSISLIIYITLYSTLAMAQSKLPACPKLSNIPWSECHGRLNFPDGRIYIGEFYHGQLNGYGTMKWPNGDKYEGYYKENYKDGYGVYHSSEGDYSGYFKNDNFNGQGTLAMIDGTKFVGSFINDEIEGFGTSYLSDGSIDKRGYWHKGKFSSAEQNSPFLPIGKERNPQIQTYGTAPPPVYLPQAPAPVTIHETKPARVF